jgi:hypothetical protein
MFGSTTTATAQRRPAYVPHVQPAPPRQARSLEDNWAAGPPFRLVLPRDKRDRLAASAEHLSRRCACPVSGCGAESLPVLLVEAEQEGVLCPLHQLVLLDGSVVTGEPMLATAVW